MMLPAVSLSCSGIDLFLLLKISSPQCLGLEHRTGQERLNILADCLNSASSTSKQHKVHANNHQVAEPRSTTNQPAGCTYQLNSWLKESRREGVYIVGQKSSERQGALLQELDETLTRAEDCRDG